MSAQLYKNILRFFSLVVVVAGVYQTYRFEKAELEAFPQNVTQAANVSTVSAYQSGVTLYSTTQAEPFVRESLTRRELVPVIRAYELKGAEWAYNTILTYGHFVVALYIYSSFKNPATPQNKKFIVVGGGLVIMFAWIYMGNQLGYEKIKVTGEDGQVLYHTEKANQKGRFEEFLNSNPKLFSVLQKTKENSPSETAGGPESIVDTDSSPAQTIQTTPLEQQSSTVYVPEL